MPLLLPSLIGGTLLSSARNFVRGGIGIVNGLSKGNFGKGLQQGIDTGWNYLSGQADLDAATKAQMELQQQAQGYNSAQAQLDREWQEKMANTAIQRQVADLKAVGLNPWLVLQGGMSGAATGSGAQATSAVGSVGSRTPKWSQLVSAANQLINTGKGAANNMASSALRVAAIAIMAAMA